MQPDHLPSGHQRRWLSAWARRVLALYPRVWRDRYSEEAAALLEDYPATPRTLFNLLLCALDAHLHTEAILGRTTPMVNRLRSSEIAIFVAFVIFCFAWFPLHFVSDTPSTWQSALQINPAIAVALTALNLAGLVALCAVLVGGLPILVTTIHQAIQRRRWGTLAMFVTPIFAALVLIGSMLALLQPSALRQAGAPNIQVTPTESLLRLALGVIALLTIGGSVTALTVALGRSEISPRLARFALIPACVATAAIGMGTIAGGALIALIVAQAQMQLGTWPPIEALMASLLIIAAALAVVSLWRGGRAARGYVAPAS